MDKNTVTGFVLIALVFLGYFYFNQPDPNKVAEQQRRQDSIAVIQHLKELEVARLAEEHEKELIAMSNDSNALFFEARKGKNEYIVLKNEKLQINISTLGARICSATLSEYTDQEGNPLTLFSDNDNINKRNPRRVGEPIENRMTFTIDGKEENIKTDEFYFTPVQQTENSVIMRLTASQGKYIDFSYRLLPDSYMVNLSIDAHNMGGILPSSTKEISIVWDQLIRQQEKGFTFEQRYSNITYKLKDDGTDYLSETSNDKETLDEPVDWVACKNQFFSCIMIAGNEFNDVVLASDTLNKGRGYLKNCTMDLSTPFDPTGKVATDIQFYLGPNKFSELMASNKLAVNGDKDLKLEKLIYFGWPIVRWINRFFIMYLFDWLSGWGLNMGIVLLLLTIIVKAVVYPFTYKSYLSSAKMRALKPHIDAINAKYPKQEDAMKKQQEIMGLYSKYGASPMGGCLPMLIQMPIFIALFNFVPNAIELRQQSFLWANDLSSYDALISWDNSIWLLGDHISIFCLLFCITQILNTYFTSKMQPNVGGSPEQEQQMKIMRWMMYLMPVMFFFMFNEYSSGLNYYYFISTLISVLIFVYLRYSIKEDELLKKMEAYYEANKSNPSKQRSGMMARLEALQQEQQRLLEEQQKRNKK